MYVYLIISAALLYFANKVQSIFLNIMAGFITIAAGVDWMSRGSTWIFVVTGVVIIFVGTYTLIMVGVDQWKER